MPVQACKGYKGRGRGNGQGARGARTRRCAWRGARPQLSRRCGVTRRRPFWGGGGGGAGLPSFGTGSRAGAARWRWAAGGVPGGPPPSVGPPQVKGGGGVGRAREVRSPRLTAARSVGAGLCGPSDGYGCRRVSPQVLCSRVRDRGVGEVGGSRVKSGFHHPSPVCPRAATAAVHHRPSRASVARGLGPGVTA